MGGQCDCRMTGQLRQWPNGTADRSYGNNVPWTPRLEQSLRQVDTQRIVNVVCFVRVGNFEFQYIWLLVGGCSGVLEIP